MSEPSMLLEFSVENSRSFRNKVTFSLVASRFSEPDSPREIEWYPDGSTVKVLPAAGIFGANGSGKSNLLKAMSDFRRIVLQSFQRSRSSSEVQLKRPALERFYRPFLLDEESRSQGTSYSIDLILNGVRWEYGFTLDSSRIISEWARFFPKGRSSLVFHREEDEVTIGPRSRAETSKVRDILRRDALLLSTAYATEHSLLEPLYEWFQRNLVFADVASRSDRQAFTAILLGDEELGDRVRGLLREADLGITGATTRHPELGHQMDYEEILDLLVGEENENALSTSLGDLELRMKHQGSVGEVELPLDDESLGTQVWFGMAGPIIDALQEGQVLLADELDASLHPRLVDVLVGLFQSKRSNPHRAQLLFNSHDVTLMGDSSEKRLGRDQIWFTEKDHDGNTRLFSLSDFSPRKHEAIARRYLDGRYGGVPLVSDSQIEVWADELTPSQVD